MPEYSKAIIVIIIIIITRLFFFLNLYVACGFMRCAFLQIAMGYCLDIKTLHRLGIVHPAAHSPPTCATFPFDELATTTAKRTFHEWQRFTNDNALICLRLATTAHTHTHTHTYTLQRTQVPARNVTAQLTDITEEIFLAALWVNVKWNLKQFRYFRHRLLKKK